MSNTLAVHNSAQCAFAANRMKRMRRSRGVATPTSKVRGQRQFRFPTQPWHAHIIGVHRIRVLPTQAVRTGSIDPTAPLSNDNKTNNIQANRKNWLRSEQAPDNTPAQCTALPNSAQLRPSPEATPAPSPHPRLPNHPSVQLAPPARGYIKSPRRAKNLRHSNTILHNSAQSCPVRPRRKNSALSPSPPSP